MLLCECGPTACERKGTSSFIPTYHKMSIRAPDLSQKTSGSASSDILGQFGCNEQFPGSNVDNPSVKYYRHCSGLCHVRECSQLFYFNFIISPAA